MRTITEIQENRIQWTETLPDSERKKWLDFYKKFWASDEGNSALEYIAAYDSLVGWKY